MINVAAIRMQQFGVQFYQASLTASDIDKLVRFEVLNYGESQGGVRGGKQKPGAGQPSKVNWDLLERRIASNEKAYQRQIIRRKIDELGPPALSRREPRDRARRRSGAERSRRFAALRRDQAARRRPRTRGAGAAGAGAQEALLGGVLLRQEGRASRGGEEILRQLLQADRAGLRRRVERPQVQYPLGVRVARVHPRGARRRAPARPGAR